MNNQENKTNGGVAILEQPTQKVLSVIAWGKKHNKQPQQIYGWLREGKIPESCIYHDTTTGRQLLIEEPMDAWYEARSTQRATNPNRKSLVKPVHVLSAMIGWFEQAKQDKIAEALKPVLDELVAQEAKEDAEAEQAANEASVTETETAQAVDEAVATDAEPTKAEQA